MLLPVVLLTLLASWLAWNVAVQHRSAGRELARFRGEELSFGKLLLEKFNTLVTALAERGKKDKPGSAQQPDERSEKLRRAGLESSEAQGKFLLMRVLCGVCCPALGAITYMHWIPYYATVFTIFMTGLGLAAPILWLKTRTASRTEDIQRELPLVLDLTNLGTSAGWDISAALERVIDALYVEFPDHPLIKELKRGRWLIMSGYTWEEALNRVAMKLGDETMKRTALALAQAIKQGGDRTAQLEGIAMDAQRNYYAELDKRLAALPVKALLITMLLMISYFMILMAPAAIQIKNVIM